MKSHGLLRALSRSRVAITAFVVLTTVAAALAAASVTRAAVGDWTQADVNAAVAKGVAYVDSTQNADGSFGFSFPAAETAFAIISYGVLDQGDYHNLSASMQTHLQAALTYLLSTQNQDGSFGPFYHTYTTGLALDGLSASTGAVPGIAAAISSGRGWLIANQQAPPLVTGNPNNPDCSAADNSGTDYYCGGWNYDADQGRSDESNTGFALTGLALTGGVPAAAAAINVDWQRHIQQLKATNYFAGRNDGGGGYDPFGNFSSDANDTGSLLFGLGYDGVAGSDTKVQAALKFGTDVLDEYELMKATLRSQIYHFGQEEDGTCTMGDAGCDWGTVDSGYHYSLWALTKGFGHYVTPDLANPANWHAKVVDLLLTEQNDDGSWPVDGRDDATPVVATSFAVDALGLVGVPTLVDSIAASCAGNVLHADATASGQIGSQFSLTLYQKTGNADFSSTGQSATLTLTSSSATHYTHDFDVSALTADSYKVNSSTGTDSNVVSATTCGPGTTIPEAPTALLLPLSLLGMLGVAAGALYLRRRKSNEG